MQYLVRTRRFCMWAVKPGDRPAGDARRREALPPVAGDLKDGPQPVAHHLVVGVERQDAPDRPALAIVGEGLRRDRNRLGAVGRPRGHGEHEDFGALAEEGSHVAVAHPVDVGLVPVVAADRHPAAEIGGRANLAEVMVAAELAVGVPGDPAEQELALDVAGAGVSDRGTPEPAAARGSPPAGRSTA